MTAVQAEANNQLPEAGQVPIVLSDEFHRALEKMRYRRIIPANSPVAAKVCSRCGQAAALVSADHPLDEQIKNEKRKLFRQLGRNPRPEESVKLHQLTSIRYATSRCCGEPYSRVASDQHQALWELWVERKTRCLKSAAELREEYAETYGDSRAARKSDDYLLMSELMATGEKQVTRFVEAMRQEEQRQKRLTFAE